MNHFKIIPSITDRSDASLGIFFKEVSKIPLIDIEEEKELSKRIKEGDKKALDKLVTSNLRFAISIAKQYQGKGLPLVDLIQEAVAGMVVAGRKFNPDRGFRFISYAVWWIRQSIIKALSSQSRTIRVPMNQVIRSGKLNKIIQKFEQENGRRPTVIELEELTELDIEDISLTLESMNRSVSLETPVKGEESTRLMDTIADNTSTPTDKEVSDNDLTQCINKVLNKLCYRDRDILRMSFGIGMYPMPHEEIAKKFGIGGERVRQIQNDALLFIRKFHSKGLKDLL